MLEIIAGQGECRYEVDEVLVAGELPGHVSVLAAGEVDTERYAEASLSDLELLGLAAEEAMEAQRGGRVAGPELDEVALQRSERRARQAEVARALRTVEGVSA